MSKWQVTSHLSRQLTCSSCHPHGLSGISAHGGVPPGIGSHSCRPSVTWSAFPSTVEWRLPAGHPLPKEYQVLWMIHQVLQAPVKYLTVLLFHGVNPGQYFLLSEVNETTIQRFCKRPTTLVWQVTKVNDKRQVALVGNWTPSAHAPMTLKQPAIVTESDQFLIKMHNKRPGCLSWKIWTALPLYFCT